MGDNYDAAAGPDLSDANVQKQIRKKEEFKKRKVVGGKPGKDGLPPGQIKADQWLVLDMRSRSFQFTMDGWRLRIGGCTAKLHHEKEFSLADIEAMQGEWFDYDFHCVTGWSHKGLRFYGVDLKHLLNETFKETSHEPEWDIMVQYGADGYSTSLPRHVVEEKKCYLVYKFDNPETGCETYLDDEHGNVRVLIPSIYGYKSCKWLRGIQLLRNRDAGDIKGFWEKVGYHPVGNVEEEERFADSKNGLVQRVLMGIFGGFLSWYAIKFPKLFLTGQQCLSFDWRVMVFNPQFYQLLLTFYATLPVYMLCVCLTNVYCVFLLGTTCAVFIWPELVFDSLLSS